MRAVSSTGRIPTRHVRIEDVSPEDTDVDLFEEACRFTGETRSSLFGYHVNRFGSVASVALYTD